MYIVTYNLLELKRWYLVIIELYADTTGSPSLLFLEDPTQIILIGHVGAQAEQGSSVSS